jgi:glycosyltransferase involved in cell wall biosynthesis
MENSNPPKVTVLMPVYNGVRYLKLAIDSILKQTFTDFEFLIINDGSSDPSEEIIVSYNDVRIVYLKNEENLGLIKTLNKGLALEKSCKLTAISDSLVATYISFGAQEEQITRIDNGVDYTRLAGYVIDRNLLLSKYDIPQNKKIIINIGRNSYKKGLDITEEVIQLVNNSQFVTFWVFIGPDMDKLADSFIDQKIKKQILALPSVLDTSGANNFPSNELVELLKLSDVFYFPTRYEEAPLILLEALATCLPVVSTHAEGVIDMITNEKEALLNEVGNTQQIAESIIRILADEKLRQDIIARGMEKAEQYNWEKISKQYIQLYQKDNY